MKCEVCLSILVSILGAVYVWGSLPEMKSPLRLIITLISLTLILIFVYQIRHENQESLE